MGQLTFFALLLGVMLGEPAPVEPALTPTSEAAEKGEPEMPALSVGLLGAFGDGALHSNFFGASAFFGLETWLPLRLSVAHLRSGDLAGTVAGSGETASLTVGRFDVALPPLTPHPRLKVVVAARLEAGALLWGASGRISGSEPWAAIGPVVRGRVMITGRFFAELEGAAALAFLRPRLLVAGAPAGEVSLLSYWVGAGVGLLLQ